MEIEEAIITKLQTNSTLTGYISSRIYADTIGGALPAVVYKKISDVKRFTLAGQIALESPMIQFTTMAATKPIARAIANEIKTTLNDFTGTLSGIEVQAILLNYENSSAELTDDGKVYYEDLEYSINFVRS